METQRGFGQPTNGNHGFETGGTPPLATPPRSRIILLARPLLDYISALSGRFERDELLTAELVKTEFQELLRKLETSLLEFPEYHERLDMVKYILTALIDEIIIFSKWQHAGEWSGAPLELDIFGKNVAGEHFFELLENHGYKDPELAELFYVSLCLGFDRKVVAEREYKKRLYSLIFERLPDYDRRLSPGAEETIAGDDSGLPPMFGLMALTIVLLVSALVYGISNQLLWNEASEFIHNLANLIVKGV